MKAGKPVTLSLVGERAGGGAARAAPPAKAARAPKGKGRAGKRKGGAGPREGSLPARILEWAKALGRDFTTADVSKQFKLTRAHASMLLSRLAGGAYAIRRASRGLYAHK